MRKAPARGAWALLLLGLALAFWAPALSAASLLVRNPARPVPPDFILPEVRSEQPFHLAGMKGRVVIVNFWWTGCPSCLAEMPALDKLWRMLKDKGVIVLGVHMGGRPDVVRRYVQRLGVSFPVLWDSARAVSRQWGVAYTPTTMILGRDGRLDYVAFGGRVWTNPEILSAIVALTRAPCPTC